MISFKERFPDWHLTDTEDVKLLQLMRNIGSRYSIEHERPIQYIKRPDDIIIVVNDEEVGFLHLTHKEPHIGEIDGYGCMLDMPGGYMLCPVVERERILV